MKTTKSKFNYLFFIIIIMSVSMFFFRNYPTKVSVMFSVLFTLAFTRMFYEKLFDNEEYTKNRLNLALINTENIILNYNEILKSFGEERMFNNYEKKYSNSIERLSQAKDRILNELGKNSDKKYDKYFYLGNIYTLEMNISTCLSFENEIKKFFM